VYIDGVVADFNSFMLLAKSALSPELIGKMRDALKKPQTPSAAAAAVVSMYRSVGVICRQGSYIGVNPTGRARRRHGVSKGSKQVPMGRPSKVEKKHRSNPKKPRNLSQSVKANKPNAKTH